MVTWYSSKITVKNLSKDLKVYMEKSSLNISDCLLMFPDKIRYDGDVEHDGYGDMER
jgi:hypothetical protein